MNPQEINRQLEEMQPWPVERLIAYLRRDHQRFLGKDLTRMRELAEALGMAPLHAFLSTMDSELRGHFRMEETIVFPVIEVMKNKEAGELHPALEYACRHMKADHLLHERHLQVLHSFTSQIDTQQGSELSIPLLNLMDDFASEMELHLKLENNFLFQPFLKFRSSEDPKDS